MKGEIRSLTGLRGLAALLVVFAHFWSWTRVTPMSELPSWMEPLTRAGGMGMAIFFTLSGYVIALSYSHWDWRARPAFNLTRLFLYRFARLYPAYFVFFVLVVLRRPDLRDLSDPETQSYLIPHLLLAQSWLPVKYGGELVNADHFHVSWSLSVECALYLGFGLGAVIVAILPRWRFKSLLLGVAFFASVLAMTDLAYAHFQPAGFTGSDWYNWLFVFSPYTVSLQFGIGVVAYRLSRRRPAERAGKLASDLGATGLAATYLYAATGAIISPVQLGLLVAIATALLMIGATSNSLANRLLSGSAIVYVGTISYSLYLFHFMAPGIVYRGEFPAYDAVAMAHHALHFMAAVALALIIATGVYTLVEVPGRRAIRAAADRWLGVQRGVPQAAE